MNYVKINLDKVENIILNDLDYGDYIFGVVEKTGAIEIWSVGDEALGVLEDIEEEINIQFPGYQRIWIESEDSRTHILHIGRESIA